MPGPIYRLLTDDHLRLAALLDSIVAPDGTVDENADHRFRAGLLRQPIAAADPGGQDPPGGRPTPRASE